MNKVNIRVTNLAAAPYVAVRFLQRQDLVQYTLQFHVAEDQAQCPGAAFIHS